MRGSMREGSITRWNKGAKAREPCLAGRPINRRRWLSRSAATTRKKGNQGALQTNPFPAERKFSRPRVAQFASTWIRPAGLERESCEYLTRHAGRGARQRFFSRDRAPQKLQSLRPAARMWSRRQGLCEDYALPRPNRFYAKRGK